MDKVYIPDYFRTTFPDISSAKEQGITINQPAIGNAEIASIQPEIFKKVLPGSPLDNKWNFIIKRGFDILVSLVLIAVVLSWLLPLLAILIKLGSPGPVFFLQKRNKNAGLLFTCIKFRSMFINKEADILVACENDKRVTPLGKYLRKYHIDELPQLFNVLIGDMSIIGPRPYMVTENIKYGRLLEEYHYRHSIKPGITGLAQSYGNFGATTNLEKVKQRTDLDIQYIRSWSFTMDLKILCRTFLHIVGVCYTSLLLYATSAKT